MEEKIVSKEDLPNESYQEGEVTYVDQGELLIVQKSLGIVHDKSEDWVYCNIFFTYCSANRKVCDVIIDNGACTKVVFIDMVNRLQLKIETHI